MLNRTLTSTYFWCSRQLPVMLQTEAAECGLVCLLMIGAYWGYKTDVGSMRRRFSISLKGATLKSLITMAADVGLSSRPLKLDLVAFPRLDGHFRKV